MTVKRGILLLLIVLFAPAAAFAPKLSRRTHNRHTLFASSPQQKADFEYQELKILTKAIVEQKVTNSRVPTEKRAEIEGYCRRIVNRRESPIPLYQIADELAGAWQLAFTTQTLNLESLPKDAIIKLDFKHNNRVDYILEFTKTFGLKRLVADSSYTVDSSPVNPGLITYTYENISTDIFGFSNVGVGFFGMLQGRSSYIETAYFDGILWIERGNDMSGEYFNVYVRV